MSSIDPYVVRGDSAAARFCGFGSRNKFVAWATAKGIRPRVKVGRKRQVYRVADLRAALDAEANQFPGGSVYQRTCALRAETGKGRKAQVARTSAISPQPSVGRDT